MYILLGGIDERSCVDWFHSESEQDGPKVDPPTEEIPAQQEEKPPVLSPGEHFRAAMDALDKIQGVTPEPEN